MHLNQSQIENNRINQSIKTALENIGSLVDVNTIIGKPLKTETGELIIPFSKVTLGVLSGGGEYGKINLFKKGSDLPYSAGNGAIISIKPCGFLYKENNKSYKLLSVSDGHPEKLIDKTLEFFNDFNKSGKDE